MKENVPWMPGLYVSVDGDIFELRNNNWVQLRIYHSLSKNHKYRRAYFYFIFILEEEYVRFQG